MVGHKLGEFSPTRQFSGHTPADKKAAQEASTGDSVTTKSAPGASAAAGSPTKAKEGLKEGE